MRPRLRAQLCLGLGLLVSGHNRYVWHDGYWTRPPYASAHWVQPHYEGQHYYYGHWDGDHGRVEHNHGWDKKKDRDYGHGCSTQF